MYRLTPWPEVVAPIRERFGALIDQACQWRAASTEPVDPDLFALVCAGSLGFDEHGPDSDLAPLTWTRIGVRALLRCGVPNWCNLNGTTTWPLEIVPATWRWLDFVHHTGRLDPRSDPLWELRKPLICYGGLDFEGRWRPADDPSPIPCECYLPYRQSAAYLNGEIQAGRLMEDVLVTRPVDDSYDGLEPVTLGPSWTSDRPTPGRARRPRPAGTRRGSRPRRGDRGDGGPRGRSPG